MTFWIDTLPYLLSCVLTIGCDLFILLQARWYSQRLFSSYSYSSSGLAEYAVPMYQ